MSLMRGKARYEEVAQHAIRQMYLDGESADGASDRIAKNLQRLSDGSIERSEAYLKIAGDALLGMVGKKASGEG